MTRLLPTLLTLAALLTTSTAMADNVHTEVAEVRWPLTSDWSKVGTCKAVVACVGGEQCEALILTKTCTPGYTRNKCLHASLLVGPHPDVADVIDCGPKGRVASIGYTAPHTW